jgi:uncharacterized repeat protein (TIGR01451 family)
MIQAILRQRWLRAIFPTLAVVAILLGSQIPAMPSQAADVNFGVGSLIIPMDVQYQDTGMWKAYGLVYHLLNNGVPVSWAIKPGKAFSGTDFTAASQDLRTGSNIGSYNYSGGPFIIDSDDAGEATPLIQAWWAKYANQPTVHVATNPFNANVDIVLRSPPRIANELANAGIAIAYYNAAGIPDLNGDPWTTSSPNILDGTEIANGALFTRGACSVRNFDIFVTPHNSGYYYSLTDPTNLGTRTYAQLDYFVQQGGGWMALCHSIVSNENAIANLYKYGSPSVRALFTSTVNGGFLTHNGFTTIANTGGTWTVAAPGLPLAQAVTTPSATQTLPGGSVQTWARTSVSYYSQTEKVAHFNNAGTIYDWAINGVAHDGTGLGKMTYLGGHSYSTSLPYSSNFEAPYLRFFYNALFFNGSAVAKLDLIATPVDVPQNITTDVVLSLTNTGSSVASNSQDVSINLPVGVEYVATIGPAPTVTVDPILGTTLAWGSALGDIDAGSTPVQVVVIVTPTTSGELEIAHVSARYGDVYNEGFTAELCRALNVYPAPEPQISKTPDSQTFYPGQTVTWDLTYSNSGGAPLYNAIVEDILPAGFVYKSATPAPSSVIPYTGGTTRVRWHLGTLAASSIPQTIALSAFVPSSLATYTNNVTLSGQDGNGNPYSTGDAADVTVVTPPAALVKTVDPVGAVDVTTPGQTLTYSIRPGYFGADLLENVLVSDPVPAFSTYVADSVNAGGIHGYAPLAKIDGDDTVDPELASGTTKNSISATPTAVAANSAVIVAMTLTNNTDETISNIAPQLTERLDGASVSAPDPASMSLNSGQSGSFTFTCTMNDIGERVFTGTATGTIGADDYTFADATSNTVLVTSFLNSSPANDVVSWRLGTNQPGVPGQETVGGYAAGVYGFRGGNTREFSRYDLPSGAWASRAQPTNGIEKGGALTIDASTYTIYASEGNSKWFYKYDIAANTWTRLADASNNFNEGGGIQYLEVGGFKYVYAVLGNSKLFRRYNIATNNWTPLADTLANVKGGGALTTDGTYLYALQGGGAKTFWRYDTGSNSWTAMASTPANVKWGGALTRVGNYIYAFQGGGTKGFWQYTISTNTWSSLANAPGNVGNGGALTSDGAYIYAFQGRTKAFWRYDIAANTWTTLAAVNFTGNVDKGGALVYDAGTSPEWYSGKMTPNASLVTTGDTVTLTLELSSSENVDNVYPSAVTVTATNGASATLSSGPTLTSADDDITGETDPVVYQWTYTATAGTIPGSLTFTASATGSHNFPAATSLSVIVSPVLTFQVRIFDAASLPAWVNQITNFGMITDSSNVLTGIESNRTATPLDRPQLLLIKSNSPTGTVTPGDVITYTLDLYNEGTGNATNVVVSDTVPVYATYVAGSASPPPASGPDPLVFDIGSLAAGTSAKIAFQVSANATGLAAGTYTIGNNFTATASNIPGTLTSNTVTNTLDVVPSFEVIKMPDVEAVSAAGNVITYTISVINSGDAELTGISISDPLLDPLPAPSGDTDSDGWLDITETWTYTPTYIVQQSDIDSNGGGDGDIDNTVTVDFAETSPQTASASVHIAVLEVIKTADPLVMGAPGTVTYEYTVKNNGSVTLNPVTLTDDKVGAVTLGTSSLAPGASTTGTATYPVTQAMIDAGTPIVNTATATGHPPSGLDVTATATATVFITQEPYMSVTKVAAESSAALGDVIHYTITITNSGSVTLTNVTPTDPLLGTLTRGTDDPGDNDELLELGECWVYTGTYTLQQSDIDNNGGGDGDIDNTVSVVTAEITPPVTARAEVVILHNPVLLVTKTGPASAAVGQTVNYTITVRHDPASDHSPVSGLVVSDTLLTLNGPTKAGGDQDDLLEWGETWTYTGSYTVKPTDPDPLVNTATATGTDGDGDTITDSDTHSLNVDHNPVLLVTKTADSAEVTVGQTVNYTVTVQHGPASDHSPVSSLVVSDTLLTLSGPTKAGGDQDDSLEWGETWTYTGSYTVPQGSGDTIDNTATARGYDGDGNPISDSDSETVLVHRERPKAVPGLSLWGGVAYAVLLCGVMLWLIRRRLVPKGGM